MSMRTPRYLPPVAMAGVFLLSACGGGGGSGPPPPPTPPPNQNKILHVVIVVQENRTVDNLFQGLPGADTASSGLNSQGQTVQLQPIDLTAPYDISHAHTAFTTEYDGGKMDGFDLVQSSSCGSACPPPNLRAYGYVPQGEVQPYFTMAEQYTFADRMFQTNEGPSFPAHQYVIAGTSLSEVGSDLRASENPHTPQDKSTGGCDAPAGSLVALIDPSGNENTTMYPCFEHPTLMDLLDAEGVSWRYYTGGSPSPGLWNAPDAISHIRNGTDYADVVGPNTQIFTDIADGHLASVSWVIPTPAESDHANSNDGSGPSWVSSVVNAIGNSPYWANTAIFVTWDDWGGWYDHVTPTIYNSYELGFRVPLLVISPYARPAYVSHVPHEFGSILKFVEETFRLGSLGYTDARADDLSDCFNFTQTPIVFRTIQSAHTAAYFEHLPPNSSNPDSDF